MRATRASDQGWRAARLIGVLSITAMVMGCAERISFGGSGTGASEPLPAAPSGPVSGGPAGSGVKTPPPVNMAGRWTLTSPGAGACAMNFGAPPGAAEGTVAPEGGCPGNFFTSRKWAFEDNALLIRDHTGQPLARLALAASGRFDGAATSGQPVSLAR